MLVDVSVSCAAASCAHSHMIAVSLLFRGRLCEGRFLFISIRLSDTPVIPVSSNASVITAESLTYRVKHLEGTLVIFCRIRTETN